MPTLKGRYLNTNAFQRVGATRLQHVSGDGPDPCKEEIKLSCIRPPTGSAEVTLIKQA